LKKLNEEFQPEVDKLNELVKKRQKIIEEAKDLSAKSLSGFYCGPDNLKDTIEEKFKSFELLNNQINDLDEKLKVAYDNRKAQLTETINKRISEKLKVFIKQKGYTTIENFESLPNITKEFIEFCNTEFEKEKAQNLK
jgi:cell shape-determining protein MreC